MPEILSTNRRSNKRRAGEVQTRVMNIERMAIATGGRATESVSQAPEASAYVSGEAAYSIARLQTRLASFIASTIFLLHAILPITTSVSAEDFITPEGLSTREARQTALREIPLQALTPEAVKKLKPVLDSPTIFRRMPTQTILCDEDLFQFLVRYPEVLVEIWDLMGMTKVTVQRLGPYVFKGNDAAGTDCKAELVYGSDNLHIYYGTGDYEGTLTGRKLEGRTVVVIHSKSSSTPDGQPQVTAHMDVFLKLDNIGADLVAKTLSPLIVRSADYNYSETLRFISQLSIAAERNPQGVDQLARRMTKVAPDIRQKFVNISIEAALRRARNEAQQAVPPKEPRVIIGQSDAAVAR
jgi:hypothetical protein